MEIPFNPLQSLHSFHLEGVEIPFCKEMFTVLSRKACPLTPPVMHVVGRLERAPADRDGTGNRIRIWVST
jgi:hypothetical protein